MLDANLYLFSFHLLLFSEEKGEPENKVGFKGEEYEKDGWRNFSKRIYIIIISQFAIINLFSLFCLS